MVKLQRKTKLEKILRIQTTMLRAIHDYFWKKGLIQIMPVIISPITDPLCHKVFNAEIKYYGQKLTLTKSMLLHKQLALLVPGVKAIYTISPNIRLEIGKCKKTGRHLIEFSQVDFEFKNAKKEDIMKFVEELLIYVFSKVKKDCAKELKDLGRKLKIPRRPFKKFYSYEVEKIYGKDFEQKLSKKMKEPFWILSFRREFYDREDHDKPGIFHNYDLVYPQGYGEALSGGEREWDYKRILKRMKETKVDPKRYKEYLKFAKLGLLPKSAGAGFGVERMLRYICGAKHIKEVCLFPKVPGEKIIF